MFSDRQALLRFSSQTAHDRGLLGLRTRPSRMPWEPASLTNAWHGHVMPACAHLKPRLCVQCLVPVLELKKLGKYSNKLFFFPPPLLASLSCFPSPGKLCFRVPAPHQLLFCRLPSAPRWAHGTDVLGGGAEQGKGKELSTIQETVRTIFKSWLTWVLRWFPGVGRGWVASVCWALRNIFSGEGSDEMALEEGREETSGKTHRWWAVPQGEK